MIARTRQQLITELQDTFETIIETYDIDAIGIFEEEGQDSNYYVGYTVKKDDKEFFINQPYKKENNQLALLNQQWTIETDEPSTTDKRVLQNLEDVLKEIVN
ncbi:DUF5634 family protein [Aquibacillus salsiterrae]|uniref:DUF5634 family protein n=1 Tax=Aquibacillus salsiterrae TaxID=2950439 RepID=A0A9X3WAD8_9BACI|nr:DUF5634 family protein [Aquibacillus salsiterrae]MDC3415457.1 DUF5634 family protein [Aquibacillus salsiterrae]